MTDNLSANGLSANGLSANAQASPRRYLALWFPFLPTERLLLRRHGAASKRPDDVALVVVEKINGALRLSAVSKKAVRLGLKRGLTLADARARIPDFAAVEADADADARLLENIGLFCERFTPLVALDPPDGLVLDISGCAHLFGGESALRQKAIVAIATIGLSVRATVAGAPDCARALARFGNVDIALPGKDEALACRLPIEALCAGSEISIALTRAGLKTLGALADRPSRILSARFGESLTMRLERTLGREIAPITPLRRPPDIAVNRNFPEPLIQAEALDGVLKSLILDAAHALEARGRGGRIFEASYFRSDGEVRRLLVETGRPSRDTIAIAKLFRERLDSIADPLDPGFGFDCIRLSVLASEPLSAAQPGLDGQTQESEAVSDLVDRLVARFGRESVMRFEAIDTHDPDRDSRLVTAAASATQTRRAAPSPIEWSEPKTGEPPSRPLQLFEPPQPIDIIAEMPDSPPVRFRWRRVLHEVIRSEGPERIESEWWRKAAPPRDYYRLEDSEGRRFWIFREGLYRDGAPAPRWFLHGLFA